MKISLIRLSCELDLKAHAGCQLSQIHKPQLLEVLVLAHPFRDPIRSLTAPTQMPNNTAAYIPVHPSHCFSGIAKRIIAGPPNQLSIDGGYQLRQADMTLARADHRFYLITLSLQCLARYGYIQILEVKYSKEAMPVQIKSPLSACSSRS